MKLHLFVHYWKRSDLHGVAHRSSLLYFRRWPRHFDLILCVKMTGAENEKLGRAVGRASPETSKGWNRKVGDASFHWSKLQQPHRAPKRRRIVNAFAERTEEKIVTLLFSSCIIVKTYVLQLVAITIFFSAVEIFVQYLFQHFESLQELKVTLGHVQPATSNCNFKKWILSKHL